MPIPAALSNGVIKMLTMQDSLPNKELDRVEARYRDHILATGSKQSLDD